MNKFNFSQITRYVASCCYTSCRGQRCSARCHGGFGANSCPTREPRLHGLPQVKQARRTPSSHSLSQSLENRPHLTLQSALRPSFSRTPATTALRRLRVGSAQTWCTNHRSVQAQKACPPGPSRPPMPHRHASNVQLRPPLQRNRRTHSHPTIKAARSLQ